MSPYSKVKFKERSEQQITTFTLNQPESEPMKNYKNEMSSLLLASMISRSYKNGKIKYKTQEDCCQNSEIEKNRMNSQERKLTKMKNYNKIVNQSYTKSAKEKSTSNKSVRYNSVDQNKNQDKGNKITNLKNSQHFNINKASNMSNKNRCYNKMQTGSFISLRNSKSNRNKSVRSTPERSERNSQENLSDYKNINRKTNKCIKLTTYSELRKKKLMYENKRSTARRYTIKQTSSNTNS